MTAPTYPRLVRIEIVPHVSGSVIVKTPRGNALQVQLTEDALRAVLGECDGTRPMAAVAAAHARPTELLELLNRLCEEGCLSSVAANADLQHSVRLPTRPSGVRPGRTGVGILGDGILAKLSLTVLQQSMGETFESVRPVREVGDAKDLALAVFDRYDHTALMEFDALLEKSGKPGSYLYFDQEKAWFGPHVRPGVTPNFAHTSARVMAATKSPEALLSRRNAKGGEGTYLPPLAERLWIVSTFFADVGHWLAGGPSLGDWRQVEMDPLRLGLTRHPILPMPDSEVHATPGQLDFGDGLERLVDERSGIITDLRSLPTPSNFPPGLSVVGGRGCDISRVADSSNDPAGGGAGFSGPDAARRAAAGELVERYCGNIVRKELLCRATYNQLLASGEAAVDPDTLVLFSQTQYEARGFPFVPLTRNKEVHWVKGKSLRNDQPVWLPASLTYINWYNTRWGQRDTPTNGTSFAGIAAGEDLEQAVLSGLLEVIERHATMVWWLNRPQLPVVEPTDRHAGIWQTKRSGDKVLRHWLLHVDNEFNVPVMAGVIEDELRQTLTVGFAARADPEEAALKAWAEGLVLQELSADLLSPDGSYEAHIQRGRLPDQGLKPWRADRKYLDDYRQDFKDVVTLLNHAQVHLDPRAIERVRPWLDTPTTRSMDTVQRPTSGSLGAISEAVGAQGYEVFYADVTTPDVQAAGLRVTRTLVPGLVGNFPAAFPLLGRKVAQMGAVRLGWRSIPLSESELNSTPMPHS